MIVRDEVRCFYDQNQLPHLPRTSVAPFPNIHEDWFAYWIMQTATPAIVVWFYRDISEIHYWCNK